MYRISSSVRLSSPSRASRSELTTSSPRRDLRSQISCHMLRATGIAAFLANGGALEHAQEIAVHEGPRATKLYERTNERLTQD